MVQKLNRAAIVAQADVHDELPVAPAPHVVDRSFELPRGLYVATVACYLLFMATMTLGFSSPQLVIPMVICVVFIVLGFGVPSMWPRLQAGSPIKAKSWAKFQREGIQSLTGHNTAGAATVQVLILPALVLVWGLAVVTIAAIVR